jgi:membrane protease subunit (stomatin/prohibitin family)
LTLGDAFRGELIDIIEWLEESSDTMVWRFALPNNEIKNGAQLIVRPGQVAIFVEQGMVADVFEGGRHVLTTENLPVLSRLRGWKYGFASPFKAEVVFVSTRQFPNNKWGTKTPVMTTDPELGPVRLRAYGTYIARVLEPKVLVTQLVGANSSFEMVQIADQIRDLIVARFSELLGERRLPVLQIASQYRELGDAALVSVGPDLQKLGLTLAQLVVESIALPDEVAATLDQRTRIGLIGDVGAYAALQSADAIRDAARNQGAGGAGAAIGVGIAMAGKIGEAASAAMKRSDAPPNASPAGPPPVPPPVPQSTMYFVAVNGQQTGPFPIEALRKGVADGSLNRDTLIWHDGLEQWKPASDLSDVAKLFV